MQLPEPPATGPHGRLAGNILLFCRTLRQAGVPIGSGQVVDALQAVRITGLDSRPDFYYALRSTLVKDAAWFALFRQAFHVYFSNPRILERAMSLLLPELVPERTSVPPGTPLRRLLEALGKVGEAADDADAGADRANSWSYQEVLRDKDFEQMSLAELSDAKALLRRDAVPLEALPTRRYRPDSAGHRYDLRRSMQLMTRNNGQLLALARKRRRRRPPPAVLICDISGSMSAYSRMFLHFAHTLAIVHRRVHTFVFSTRLNNVSRALSGSDADRALGRVARQVSDWDGGTRIAACLERFNHDWNRRVLGQNATVILLTDGLERDSADNLARQMQRLRRSCRELIWLNPVLRYRDFQPLAQGIRAMLPTVDRFLPAHNLRSLADVFRILHHGQSGSAEARARAAHARSLAA